MTEKCGCSLQKRKMIRAIRTVADRTVPLSKLDTRAYDANEKRIIIEYMSAPDPFAAGGMVFDRTKRLKTRIEDVGYTDGTYVWSSQDMYDISNYDMAVTDDFIEHVKTNVQ